MKYFSYTLIGIAILLIGYNSTFLDFKNLFNDDSGVALIGIITNQFQKIIKDVNSS